MIDVNKKSQKQCAPKLVFFDEKELREIPMILEIENWHLPVSQILKIQQFSLGMLILRQKSF